MIAETAPVADESAGEDYSLADAAHMAWARKAQLDEARVTQSFRTKLFQALKVKGETYDVYAELFPDEFDPKLRIGTEIDGLTFCLDKNGALAVVAWRCQEKGCAQVERLPFNDFVTLGRALASGEHVASEHPRCQRHSKRA